MRPWWPPWWSGFGTILIVLQLQLATLTGEGVAGADALSPPPVNGPPPLSQFKLKSTIGWNFTLMTEAATAWEAQLRCKQLGEGGSDQGRAVLVPASLMLEQLPDIIANNVETLQVG